MNRARCVARVLDALIGAFPSSVRSLTPAQVRGLIDDAPQDVVLLDVRTAAEHAVSHIAGARLVDPSLAWDPRLDAAEALRGRIVVCYCAVGWRSVRFVARNREALLRTGAASVHNLSGGLFRWHDEHLPLVNRRGTTELLHPYAPRWVRLMVRRHLAATIPAGNTASPGASLEHDCIGDLTRSPPSD